MRVKVCDSCNLAIVSDVQRSRGEIYVTLDKSLGVTFPPRNTKTRHIDLCNSCYMRIIIFLDEKDECA